MTSYILNHRVFGLEDTFKAHPADHPASMQTKIPMAAWFFMPRWVRDHCPSLRRAWPCLPFATLVKATPLTTLHPTPAAADLNR